MAERSQCISRNLGPISWGHLVVKNGERTAACFGSRCFYHLCASSPVRIDWLPLLKSVSFSFTSEVDILFALYTYSMGQKVERLAHIFKQYIHRKHISVRVQLYFRTSEGERGYCLNAKRAPAAAELIRS